MTKRDILKKIRQILDETPVAVLTTVDGENRPHARWMTPVFLKHSEGAFYSVTSPHFQKLKHLEKNSEVEWMFQTPLLNEIINIKGFINIIDNSQVRAEVLENAGKKLTVFWNYSHDSSDLLVLETVIREAVHMLPMQGSKTIVDFGRGE